MIRVIVKSHENGGNEEVYLASQDDKATPPEDYFFLRENESIDFDILIDCPKLENSSFPFDRVLKVGK